MPTNPALPASETQPDLPTLEDLQDIHFERIGEFWAAVKSVLDAHAALAVRAEGLTQRVAELEAVVADVWAIAQGTVFASPPQASAGIAEDAKQVVQWATKAMDALGRIGLKTAKVRSLTLKTPTP